jgi:hypothetical protein
MTTAPLLGLGTQVDEDNFHPDRNGDRVVLRCLFRLQVLAVIKVEFLDWRKLIQAVEPKHEIERFANRALTHIVRTNEQGVTIEPKIGGFNAPEISILSWTTFTPGSSTMTSAKSLMARAMVLVAPGAWKVMKWFDGTSRLKRGLVVWATVASGQTRQARSTKRTRNNQYLQGASILASESHLRK